MCFHFAVVMEVEVGAQEIPIEPLALMEDDGDANEDDEIMKFETEFADHLLKKRSVESNSMNEEEGEKEEGEEKLASPIRTEWPSDTALKPSHFTIDTQRCLNCCCDLGYAMPMNRTPNPLYLFCRDKEECKTAALLKCWACGNFNSERSGHIVSRPGNSAFQGPSSIYSFMCLHCYNEQLALEPSAAETKEMFAKYREIRRQNEEAEKDKYDFLHATGGTQGGYPQRRHPRDSRKRRRESDGDE